VYGLSYVTVQSSANSHSSDAPLIIPLLPRARSVTCFAKGSISFGYGGVNVKAKESRNKPGVAQRVPGV